MPQAVAPHGQAAEFVKRMVEALLRYRQRNDSERWDDRGAVLCPDSAPQPDL